MPPYEKPPIIIEIGHAYTKYGFSGELAPHSIIPTKMFQNTISTNANKSMSIYDYKNLVNVDTHGSKANKEEECLREMLIDFFTLFS